MPEHFLSAGKWLEIKFYSFTSATQETGCALIISKTLQMFCSTFYVQWTSKMKKKNKKTDNVYICLQK